MCCSVNLSVCLVCCVFVNCSGKQFAICLGVVVILLLNVMEVFSVGGDALLDRPCIVYQISVCLCMSVSEVISAFRSLRAGSQVFALLMLFMCVMLHAMYIVQMAMMLTMTWNIFQVQILLKLFIPSH